MKPFRVTIIPGAPLVAGNFPLHLDAILMWAEALRTYGVDALSPYGPALVPPAIPIAYTGSFYRASSAIFVPPIYYGSSFAVRAVPEFLELLDSSRRVEVQRNARKLSFIDLRWFLPRAVVFFGVGDPQGVHDILCYITHLGKYRRYGYGLVRKFRVDVIDSDCSVLYNRRLVRAVPEDEPEAGNADPKTYVFRSCPCSPPYRDLRRAVPCKVPLTPITEAMEVNIP